MYLIPGITHDVACLILFFYTSFLVTVYVGLLLIESLKILSTFGDEFFINKKSVQIEVVYQYSLFPPSKIIFLLEEEPLSLL